MSRTAPHQYNGRRCWCYDCRWYGYHRPGRVTRLLARHEGVSWGSDSWGYMFDWDKGRSVCRKCGGTSLPCRDCLPVWAMQAGF